MFHIHIKTNPRETSTRFMFVRYAFSIDMYALTGKPDVVVFVETGRAPSLRRPNTLRFFVETLRATFPRRPNTLRFFVETRHATSLHAPYCCTHQQPPVGITNSLLLASPIASCLPSQQSLLLFGRSVSLPKNRAVALCRIRVNVFVQGRAL